MRKWQRNHCTHVCQTLNSSIPFTTSLHIGCPQRQVVAKELHDQCGILVGIFSHIVQFSNCIFKRSPCHLTCFIRIVQHFVLENGEVQCKAKADRVCHCKIFFRHFLCFIVRFACIL